MKTVTRVDWLALAFVALTALIGLRKGLIGSALSVAGIIFGAYVGARLAPQLLTGGSNSPYTPLAGLAGRRCSAPCCSRRSAGWWGASFAGRCRSRRCGCSTRSAASCWESQPGLRSSGSPAPLRSSSPGRRSLRRSAQESLVLQHLYDVAAADQAAEPARARRPVPADRRAALAGRAAGSSAPSLPRRAACGAERRACARDGAAGCGSREAAGSPRRSSSSPPLTSSRAEDDTVVAARHPSRSCARDGGRVRSQERRRGPAGAAPARPAHASDAEADSGEAVAILGYPENGPLSVVPGRLGSTTVVLSQDAYGHGPVRAQDHCAPRPRAARQLRRSDDRCFGCGLDDRVRGAPRESGRLRRAERHRRQDPVTGAQRATGFDRHLHGR